ncbi:S8 family serine peptidase, partial [bacterium]|nr:S8 family serine peptidase [bacterium]
MDKIVSEVGGTIIETLPQISVIRIKLEPQISVAEAIQILEELEEVEYVEPNGICYMDVVEPVIPDDSDYGSQWAPQLTGAESAWAVTTGDVGVIIAIADTGVDGTHPDFGGKIIAGYDTFNNIAILAGTDSSVYYHGTHCAGIAAAVGNNSQGIAGVAWGSKIMPIKICKDVPNYSARWSDMAEAFIWAAENGADIISCSFGGKGYSQTMKDAIDYAVIDMGCAMFASMGNSSRNETSYPAGYQSVIAVGATDAHDEIASFSTTGDHMSVCAPGVEIYSTMPGGGYDYLSGTSMSCPFVAGAAALILSQNPGMSPEGVKTQLEDTAFDLGSTGFDSTFGYGRIDLAAAVGAVNPNKYGVVDVLVTDRLSHPISGASVILWQGGTVISTTNSNEDGHAIFEYIPAGDYQISVSFPGFDSRLAADNPVTVVA